MSEKQEGDSSSSIRNITPQSQPSTMPSTSSVRNVTPSSHNTTMPSDSCPSPSRVSSSSSSYVSNTSTLYWDHVPYEQYLTRVQDLVHERWPSIPHDQVSVERLKGGSYNRVIGFSFHSPEDSQREQYIIRIPRYTEHQVHRNVASVKFVQQYTTIPVPQIHAFDTTTSNFLEDPHMIQSRAAGQSLLHTYPDLSHATKCMIAQQMGDVTRNLLSLEGPCIGSLALLDTCLEDQEFAIEPISGAGAHDSIPYCTPTSSVDVTAALTQMFEYRRKEALAAGHDWRVKCMRNLIIMTAELSAAGHLTDVPVTLCHMDLEARNIIAFSDDDNKNGVSAIIDWDATIFAPCFAACKPPSWIWAWSSDEDNEEEDNDDQDEIVGNNLPLLEEAYQLKDIFEKAAGPVYQRFAHVPQYRLARRLMYFAINHILHSTEMKMVDELLEEWVSMQEGNSGVNLDMFTASDTEDGVGDTDDEDEDEWETTDDHGNTDAEESEDHE